MSRVKKAPPRLTAPSTIQLAPTNSRPSVSEALGFTSTSNISNHPLNAALHSYNQTSRLSIHTPIQTHLSKHPYTRRHTVRHHH